MGARILHAARRASLLVLAAMAAVAASGTFGNFAATAAASPTYPGNSLRLISESPAFVSSSSGITLSLEIDSPQPASQLSLLVTLFSHVSARYTFRETLGGDTAGLSALPGGPQIPLDTPGLDWAPGSDITIHLPVSAPDLPGQARGGTDHALLDINECAPPNCGGVYPMQVSLVDSDLGQTLTSFTTDLIVTPPSERNGSFPVRFAWTMPLGSSPAISPHQLPLKDEADLSELHLLSVALARAPGVRISLDVFPQFVEALRVARARRESAGGVALAQLSALTRAGGPAGVLAGTYGPVDLRALVSGGLGSYVAVQLARGREVLQGLIPFEQHTYVANTPVASRSLAVLEAAGVTRLLVPNASVKPEPASLTLTTPTAPFLIPHSGVEAMASDAYLEDDLADTAPPALKAQQMLADLALVYFDEPSNPEKAVALLSPLGWHPSASFLDAVLTGLSGSGIVDAVTLGDLFDNVVPGAGGSPAERRLEAPPPPPSVEPSARAVATAAAQLDAVSGILPLPQRVSAPLAPLSDLLLLSQASDLSASARVAYLNAITGSLRREASLITIPFGHTITITSLQAKIPISILSGARVPLHVKLEASSPDLGFPHGHRWSVTLTSRTNVVEVQLLARSSGDLPLRLVVSAPNGIPLQAGALTIRSTAISGVAVGLSFGAVAFLVVWWLRAIVQKRRRKHRLRGAALAASAIPGSDPVVATGKRAPAPGAPGHPTADSPT